MSTTRQRHRCRCPGHAATRGDARNHAWFEPLPDPARVLSWAITREAIHAAIQRARWATGYADPAYSALGDHLYGRTP